MTKRLALYSYNVLSIARAFEHCVWRELCYSCSRIKQKHYGLVFYHSHGSLSQLSAVCVIADSLLTGL